LSGLGLVLSWPVNAVIWPRSSEASLSAFLASGLDWNLRSACYSVVWLGHFSRPRKNGMPFQTPLSLRSRRLPAIAGTFQTTTCRAQ